MKDIPGYEGEYAITSCGKVWSYKRGRFLAPRLQQNGYTSVALCKNGIRKNELIHRLVALAYIANPLNLSEVNHLDEDKLNNALPNLEWCSHKYNCNYGTRNEKQKITKRSKLNLCSQAN